MKIIILLISSFILNFNFLLAQINVGSSEYVRFDAGKILPEDIELLKSTTTLFVYRDIDEPILDKIKKAFEQSWTITKVEFIRHHELSKYANKSGYSYFMIEGFIRENTSISI